MPKSLAPVLLILTATLPIGAQPAPSITSVVNAASFAATPLAPGSIATAFGSFLLPAPVGALTVPLPVSLSGLSLAFGGQPVPLFYASATQVNFQVPWELAGITQTSLTASLNGQVSQAQTVNLASFAPAIFTLNEQGTSQGLIVDPFYHVVDASNPATPGVTIVLIYATGLGAVTNPPTTGSPAPIAPLSQTDTPTTVTIGGVQATVLFSGLAPGEVGVYQINALVPAASAGGTAVPVSLSIGGATSNTVSIAVNSPTGPNPMPLITGLSPSAASPGAASATLTVSGSGFTSSSSVTFNGINHPASFVSATQMAVPLTSADLAAAGAFPVTVTNPAPGGGTSNAVNFLVDAGFGSGPATSTGWSGVGRDDRHTALSPVQSQPLDRIHWSTPVDLQPQFTDSELLIHYGAPLITPQNTVIVPVKTGATSGFRIEAHKGADGTLLWSAASDYILPPHDWVPEFAPALTPASRVYFPGAGGTVYFRDSPDSTSGAQGQLAFYGLSTYQANPQSYNSNVMISTPITSDSAGNVYFGFQVTGATPASLASGIARISAAGQGTWISAAAAAGDSGILEVPQNCAPALNENAGLVYVAVSNGSAGYLLALNNTTLEPVAKIVLRDPVSGLDGVLSDDGSAAPTIGPDGDVYYGILENPNGSNHYRGWLLHFNSSLSQSKTTGAFGWDDTASVVPSFMVQSYSGASPYLLMTKYNDYASSAGGMGQNRIAVLDPNATEKDPVTGATVMKEVLTILGPTPSTTEPGVKEWCINSAAVDPATHSILANSEDGNLYRWDLSTNSFSQRINLTAGIGEAYTPTLIGPDGTVYAINDAVLYAIGQ